MSSPKIQLNSYRSKSLGLEVSKLIGECFTDGCLVYDYEKEQRKPPLPKSFPPFYFKESFRTINNNSKLSGQNRKRNEKYGGKNCTNTQEKSMLKPTSQALLKGPYKRKVAKHPRVTALSKSQSSIELEYRKEEFTRALLVTQRWQEHRKKTNQNVNRTTKSFPFKTVDKKQLSRRERHSRVVNRIPSHINKLKAEHNAKHVPYSGHNIPSITTGLSWENRRTSMNPQGPNPLTEARTKSPRTHKNNKIGISGGNHRRTPRLTTSLETIAAFVPKEDNINEVERYKKDCSFAKGDKIIQGTTQSFTIPSRLRKVIKHDNTAHTESPYLSNLSIVERISNAIQSVVRRPGIDGCSQQRLPYKTYGASTHMHAPRRPHPYDEMMRRVNVRCRREHGLTPYTPIHGGTTVHGGSIEDDEENEEINEPGPCRGQGETDTLMVTHTRAMEHVTRACEQDDVMAALRGAGQFSFNYDAFARTTLDNDNIKQGRKKGLEQLYYLVAKQPPNYITIK